MLRRCVCLYCGVGFVADVVKGGHRGKFCCSEHYHKHRIGKPFGDTSERKNYLLYGGYRWVRVPLDYRGGFQKGLRAGKYIREHRFVAERMLGRALKKEETVHHINGNKLDNRPENLLVMTQNQHKRLETELARLYMRECFGNKENPKKGT